MKALSFYSSLLLFSILIFTSCSDDGEIGPQGPQGNANVIAKQVTFTNLDYTSSYFIVKTANLTTTGYPSRKAVISDPALTNDIFQNGVVLIYMDEPSSLSGSNNSWAALPAQTLSLNSAYFMVYSYRLLEGSIEIHYYHQRLDIDESPSVSQINLPTHTFKYVILSGPAAIAAKEGRLDAGAIRVQ